MHDFKFATGFLFFFFLSACPIAQEEVGVGTKRTLDFEHVGEGVGEENMPMQAQAEVLNRCGNPRHTCG